ASAAAAIPSSCRDPPRGPQHGMLHDKKTLGGPMTPFRILVAALLLAPLSAPLPARAQVIEHPKLTLSIGTFIISYLPLPVAEAKGFFKREGLDVTIQNFGAGGAKALQSLIGGSSDVVVGFYDHTVQMQAEGQDVRCVILLNRNPGIALAVREDLVGTIK